MLQFERNQKCHKLAQVATHFSARASRVSRFKGVYNSGMLGKRFGDTSRNGQNKLSCAIDMNPGGLGYLSQLFVSGEIHDHFVHLPVLTIETSKISVFKQRLLNTQVSADVHQLFLGDTGREEFDGCQFDRFAQERSLANFAHRESGDVSSGLRNDLDESFRRKSRNGFGDRGSGYAQCAANFGLLY